ncbi:MAG: hypothetical protein HOQ11_15345 [Gemmatimonadaceae bacterium]|nr:hypothetical protein [Gemmatimonadaceae bacterium]NUQ92501.1 hypothetical protein [Gemmatimonadaceae bacterium]NUR18536.1 hypothetical protein [Gemmatimonadaceae bacterium]NUS98776.1 hypothetical protein [Gemmatimonadaceae bacterium]
MPIPEILIMIVGMGDPESGDTDAWAQALFPGGSLVTTGDRKVMYTGAREIHLFEVIYEDSNEAIRQKFETLSHLLPSATPEQVKDSLEDYAYDVVENVLLRGALDAAQLRFVQTYARALKRALELVGPTGDIHDARIGVLSHSLGTYIGYEGIYRAFDTAALVQVVDVNLVTCAPMLAPIYHVLHALGADRYLTENACRKPYKRTASGRWYSMIRRCGALYNRKDPFIHINDAAFYARTPDNDLVDEFRLFSTDTPLKRFWEGHSMIESYIAHNREVIASWLF